MDGALNNEITCHCDISKSQRNFCPWDVVAMAWIFLFLIFPILVFAEGEWRNVELDSPVEVLAREVKASKKDNNSLRKYQDGPVASLRSDSANSEEVITWKEFSAGIRGVRAQLYEMATKEELDKKILEIIFKLDEIARKVELNMKVVSVFGEELDARIEEVLLKQGKLVTKDELNERLGSIIVVLENAVKKEELNMRVAEIFADQNNMVRKEELHSRIEKVVSEIGESPKDKEWLVRRGGVLKMREDMAMNEKVNVGIKDVIARAKKKAKDEEKIDALIAEEINMNQNMFGDIYYGLALVYTRQKQYRKAINAYEQVIQHTSAYPDAYYHLGLLYEYLQEDSQKAYHYFKKCLSLDISPETRKKAETLVGFME